MRSFLISKLAGDTVGPPRTRKRLTGPEPDRYFADSPAQAGENRREPLARVELASGRFRDGRSIH
jgi:hypothetical protein